MNTYTKDHARFSVLCDGVIRIEYATDDAFIDARTFFALRDAKKDAEFIEKDGVLTVETPKITLKYSGGEFTKDSLWAEIHTGGVNEVWHYGDTPKNNLGGTLSTLDDVKDFVPVPDGLLSKDGFYVVDDSGKAVFDDDWAHTRSENHLIDIYLFAYGHDWNACLKDFAAVSGKSALPRKYFMGSWYSRWHYFSADEYLGIVDDYKKYDFPIDIMVIDLDWHYHDWNTREKGLRAEYGYGHAGGNMGWTGYTWVKERFPDPKGFFKKLHEKGVAAALSDHPCDGVRDNDDTYPEFIRLLDEAGYKEEVPDNEELMDAVKNPERAEVIERHKKSIESGIRNYRFNAGSKAYMNAFFNSALKAREEDGIDFWWMDWQQDYIYPEVNGIKGLNHTQWLNELYFERSRQDGKRGINFARWGGFGDQRHPGNFSGDTRTCFRVLDFEIQMTVTSGNAGCFYWTHDIGGFHDPEIPKQSEVYARWVQFGAFSPVLRIHCCGEDNDRRPWLWGEPWCSAIRNMFHLRSRLFPYIYSSAYQSSENCIPLLRPLYWEEPENEEAYKHPSTYKFGDAFLVSPIVEAGKGENYTVDSDVWLPEGVWYDWFSGKRYEGHNTITVTNGLYSFPLFIRAGIPVASRPYTDRMATAPLDNLEVLVYADKDVTEGASYLYEDDGLSEVDDKKCRITDIKYVRDGNRHTVTLTPSGKGYEGEPEKRTVVLKLFNVPSSIHCDNAEIEYNKTNSLAIVTIEDVSVTAPVEFTLYE